ncbi:MAG: hypothetical protein ABI317_10015 [Gaiellales bacterium]
MAVPDPGEGRRRRAARLIAGGVLGAAVVLGRRRRGLSEPGLRAFEDAPCFRELTGQQRRPAAAPEGDDGR